MVLVLFTHFIVYFDYLLCDMFTSKKGEIALFQLKSVLFPAIHIKKHYVYYSSVNIIDNFDFLSPSSAIISKVNINGKS